MAKSSPITGAREQHESVPLDTNTIHVSKVLNDDDYFMAKTSTMDTAMPCLRTQVDHNCSTVIMLLEFMITNAGLATLLKYQWMKMTS